MDVGGNDVLIYIMYNYYMNCSGVISQLVNGEEGESDAVYGVSYSDDDEITELTRKEILEDIASGSLHFF